MFEKYTDKARRVIFFARYEASQSGSRYIEIPHLVLGVMREKALFNILGIDFSNLRETIAALCPQTGERISTSVDLPLSHTCKRVLEYAAEEARLTSSQNIGTGHLLLGVLREGGEAANCLTAAGVTLDNARAALTVAGIDAPEASPAEKPPMTANRQAAIRFVTQLPEERMEAAVHLLSGLSSDFITLTGSTASGRFEFTFGKPPAPAES